MKRSLSKKESDLILALEWEKKNLIHLKDIARRLKCSYGYARKLAHTLSNKGWLEPISHGNYLLISADRGPKGIPEMNAYIISRVIDQPYFYAYRFACVHHGLLTQIPSVIHIAVKHQKRPLEIKNTRFEFIILTSRRFFGFEHAEVFGEKINVSDLERTVLDAFDRPELVGGIEAVAQIMFEARKRVDCSKLLSYLKKMKDSALARRFGYMAEMVEMKLSRDLKKYLNTQIKKDPALLGAAKRWGTEGPRNQKWNLIENVPGNVLMGEVRIG